MGPRIRGAGRDEVSGRRERGETDGRMRARAKGNSCVGGPKAGATRRTPSGWLEEKGANERTSGRPRNDSSRGHDQSGVDHEPGVKAVRPRSCRSAFSRTQKRRQRYAERVCWRKSGAADSKISSERRQSRLRSPGERAHAPRRAYFWTAQPHRRSGERAAKKRFERASVESGKKRQKQRVISGAPNRQTERT